MEIYKTPIGILVMEGDKVVDKKLFAKDPKQVAKKLKEASAEEKAIRSKYPKVRESRKRLSLADIAEEVGFCKKEEFGDFLSKVNQEMSKTGVKEGFGKDKVLINAVRAHRSLEDQANTMSEMLREWYSIHFPELNGLLKENSDYAKVVLEIGSREKMSVANLEKVLSDKRYPKAIAEITKESAGADIDEEDFKAVRGYAGSLENCMRELEVLKGYIEKGMNDSFKNLSAIATPYVGAILLEEAGSIERLAKVPASTVQVLGAQKAMFRFLKTHKLPPKYGVLYIHPTISQAPKSQKGKLARTLASKISIAAKVDFYGGEYIGDRLNEEMKVRVKSLKK